MKKLSAENNEKLKGYPNLFVCLTDGKIDGIGDVTKIENIQENDDFSNDKFYIGYSGGWIRCDRIVFLCKDWTNGNAEFNDFLQEVYSDSDYWSYHFREAVSKDIDWNSLVDDMLEFLASA